MAQRSGQAGLARTETELYPRALSLNETLLDEEFLGSSSDITTADTPTSGVRVASGDTTLNVGVGASDVASGVRLGLSDVQVVFDVVVFDGPTGTRLGVSPASAGSDTNVVDTPGAVRVGTNGVSVVADTLTLDVPTGVRLALSLANVTLDVTVTDTPTGLRVGVSAAAAVTAVTVTDTPEGVRLGVSIATLALDVVGVDQSNGIRVGTSSATISIDVDVAVPDVPAGVRLGESTPTVAITTNVSDLAGGVRLGESLSGVSTGLDVIIADLSSFLRLGASLTSITILGAAVSPGVFAIDAVTLLTADIVTGTAGIAQALAAQSSGGGVQRALVAPGAVIAWDDCTCGQLTLHVNRVYPSRRFPDDWSQRKDGNCTGALAVVDMTLTLTRCVPGPDVDGTPPSIRDMMAAANVQFEDTYIMRSTLECYLKNAYQGGGAQRVADYLVGEQVPVGPSGGCASIETRFKVAWWADCGC